MCYFRFAIVATSSIGGCALGAMASRSSPAGGKLGARKKIARNSSNLMRVSPQGNGVFRKDNSLQYPQPLKQRPLEDVANSDPDIRFRRGEVVFSNPL